MSEQEAVEKIAAWMISKGFATGHGESIEDLLEELEWQRVEEQREWVGLTKDEIIDITIEAFGSPYDVAVYVEAKLKERNT
jgi:type 1 glutamine amidotransferase